MKKKITWFKQVLEPKLKEFKIEYSFFEKGDFGDLNRVEFEGNNKGGNIDFWEKEWMEVHLYDYEKDQELIHCLLEPKQDQEKDIVLKELLDLLLC